MGPLRLDEMITELDISPCLPGTPSMKTQLSAAMYLKIRPPHLQVLIADLLDLA